MRIPTDDYITAEQFRALWGMDKVSAVKRLIKWGCIPYIKFGKEYLIPRSAIIDYSKMKRGKQDANGI